MFDILCSHDSFSHNDSEVCNCLFQLSDLSLCCQMVLGIMVALKFLYISASVKPQATASPDQRRLLNLTVSSCYPKIKLNFLCSHDGFSHNEVCNCHQLSDLSETVPSAAKWYLGFIKIAAGHGCTENFIHKRQHQTSA